MEGSHSNNHSYHYREWLKCRNMIDVMAKYSLYATYFIFQKCSVAPETVQNFHHFFRRKLFTYVYMVYFTYASYGIDAYVGSTYMKFQQLIVLSFFKALISEPFYVDYFISMKAWRMFSLWLMF